MAKHDVSVIRNFSVVAHGGAGKTSLVEAMLYSAGAIDRMGSVDAGNTVTDFDPEEIERRITISSAVAYCDWKGSRMNIIDTPGFINFIEDARGCLRVSDGAVIIVSAISGVKAETEKIWKYACEFELPRIIFVNKMDRENADFARAVGEIEKSFETEAIALNIPIGEGPSFSGIVDIVKLKAYRFTDGGTEEADIPSELAGNVELYRKKLVEKIAESDDVLLERYLEGGELTADEIVKGIKEGSLTRKFIPVVCGSAVQNRGVDMLMDTALLCLPSPEEMARISPVRGRVPGEGSEVIRQPDESEPFSAYVFKTIADPFTGKLTLMRVYSGSLSADSTVYNSSSDTKERIGQVFHLLGKKHVPAQVLGPGEIGGVAKLKATNTGDTLCDPSNPVVFDRVRFSEPIISYAIAPKSKGDEDKVSSGLHRILEEDPTLRFHRDEDTNEMLLSGMGQVHIEIAIQKLKRKFGVDVEMKTPKIPYRETIRAHAKAQGKYKKQSGGRGQYGDCWIEIEPLPRGGGFEFVNKIVGGVIPRQYIPAVEKGVREAMQSGCLAGYPVVDVKVRLYDGSHHSVDSSEMAFKIAASMGFKKAMEQARPVILEPVMSMEINVPDECLGDVIGDINSKRGKVQGVEPKSGSQTIKALVPMAEVLNYATELKGMTADRGIFTMTFSHYEEVPQNLAQKIIENARARKGQA